MGAPGVTLGHLCLARRDPVPPLTFTGMFLAARRLGRPSA